MLNESSLFQRLEKSCEAVYSIGSNQQALMQSVKVNLQQMLNVREGSVSALPDYGMPDFNDLVYEFPDAIYQLQVAIKRFLLKYEPRLDDVLVNYVPDSSQPLQLKYRVSVQIHQNRQAEDPQNDTFEFETVITGSGQAFISAA
jgi:type VI secretion system protein